MQFEKKFFPIFALGPGARLGIWTLGCPRSCKGCANPETQKPNPSREISVEDFLVDVDWQAINGVTISGGDPFMQRAELKHLVRYIRECGITDILVYTGYTIEELKSWNDPDVTYVLSNIAVLIDGVFIENLHDNHRLKGSSNQKIYYLDPSIAPAYEAYIAEEKTIDCFYTSNGEVHYIGIPPKNFKEIYPLIVPKKE